MKSVEFEFDTVKAEKAEAIRLYKRKRTFAILLRSAAFLAVMFSASWLSTSSFSSAGDLLRESEVFLNRPVFMFALLNLIIAVLFFSSGRKPTSSNIYDEYVAVGSHQNAAVFVSESFESAKNAIGGDSAQTVTDTMNTVAVADSGGSNRDDVAVSGSAMVSEVNKSKKRYRRSKSDYIPRELRGSDDDEMAVAEPRRKSMDDLSNEEFRLKIEKFIAAKKKTLIQENIAEIRG